MRTKFNRFAIIPTLCNSCKEFITLEPYRKSDVLHIIGGYYKENICKRCISKYDVGVKENEYDEE